MNDIALRFNDALTPTSGVKLNFAFERSPLRPTTLGQLSVIASSVFLYRYRLMPSRPYIFTSSPGLYVWLSLYKAI